MKKTVAVLILEALKAAGVDRIFGIAGGGPTADFISYARETGIKFVLTQHETSAVIAAGLYGQMTGTVGVAISAIGPGVSNLATGVAHAYCDRLPVLLFSDRYSSGVHEVALRQQFDHLAFMRPITKAQMVLHESTFMTGLRRAIRTALSEKPGPVFIELPGNVATAVGSASPASIRFEGDSKTPSVIRDADLERAFDRLSRSRRPVILSGLGVLRIPDGAVGELASALRAPVLTSPKAKGSIATDHPWCAGVFMGGKLEQSLLERADTIFFLGYDPVELLPKPWSAPNFIVSMDWSPNTEQVFHSDIELSGNLDDGVQRLASSMSAAASEWRIDDVARYKKSVFKAVDVKVKGLNPNDIVLSSRRILPKDTILTTDVGANKLVIVELWESYASNEFHMSNGLGTMGFSLPSAIAAKMARPKAPVVCMCGDAGFLMRLPELVTVQREKLKIIFVIFADNEHSLITLKQVIKGVPKYGMEFPRPNYLNMAKTFGMRGFTASTVKEYEAALSKAVKHPGSSIIEACIDPSGYVKQFEAIREL